MLGFFRWRAGSAAELIAALRKKALLLCPDPLMLWKLTAWELYELAAANDEKNAELYRANEYLAFNTAALCISSFNAPDCFPATPLEAFPKPRSWREAKAEMMKISDNFKNVGKERQEEQERSEKNDG